MKKKNNDSQFVYSTNPDYSPEEVDDDNEELNPDGQNLRLFPDRKNRKGKTVTVVAGFKGSEDQIKEFSKQLKALCGAGGTVKDGEILIQGNFIDKIGAYLKKEGHHYKVSGV